MLLPPSFLDELRDKVSLSSVIGRKVKLTRRGREYTGLCPFHHEKTPSFTVLDSGGFYKCFGCGKAGDGVRFLMDHEHYTYPEALRYLAKKYNIKIEEKELSADEIMAQSHREKMFNINDFANKYFFAYYIVGICLYEPVA